ncbi:MAG: uroporphyrinogen decarboxylase family protein [bacterium]|nr:uroporphyrinogen decarboxylase family protein [bacterium]
MNSRERVMAAIGHEEVDRLPIDFGAMRSTGIMAIAYNKLKKHLGFGHLPKTKVYDVMQQLAEPDLEVVDCLGGDVVQVHRLAPAFGAKVTEWREDILPDGSECLVPESFRPGTLENGDRVILDGGREIARMPAGGLYYEFSYFPLADARTPSDIKKRGWPLISQKEVLFLRQQAERWRRETDKAILGAFGGNILESGQFDFGWGEFMVRLYTDRKLIEYYLDRLAEWHLQNLELYLGAVGDEIDIIQMGDDLGTQQGLQLSPEMYRQLIKPRHRKVYEYVHEHSDVKVFLHSCGSIVEIIPDLIEIGVDILNPVQTTARGMEPETLKRNFGKEITFWGGGCDTQHVLPFGTVKDVKRDVEERLRIFAEGSGYVFTQIHNIQADIAPEKVVAIYETAKGFRI